MATTTSARRASTPVPTKLTSDKVNKEELGKKPSDNASKDVGADTGDMLPKKADPIGPTPPVMPANTVSKSNRYFEAILAHLPLSRLQLQMAIVGVVPIIASFAMRNDVVLSIPENAATVLGGTVTAVMAKASDVGTSLALPEQLSWLVGLA